MGAAPRGFHGRRPGQRWNASAARRCRRTPSASSTPCARTDMARTAAIPRVGAPAVCIVWSTMRDLYLVDLKAGAAAPDPDAASSTDPEWSAKGDAIYFLSRARARRRSGACRWRRQGRRSGPRDRPAARRRQLPRVPDGRAHRAEHGGVPRLRRPRLHQGRASTRKPPRARPAAWSTTACSCATGIPGPMAATPCCISAPLDASGRVSGAPVSLSGSLDGDVPSKPFGDREEYRFSPDGKTVVFSVRIAGKTEAWSTNFDLYSVPAAGGSAPRNLTPGIRPGIPRACSRRTAAPWPTWRWRVPASRPTATRSC
jgi:dipeptidyl aminopeptidase/acylaminoacyl peptidase